MIGSMVRLFSPPRLPPGDLRPALEALVTLAAVRLLLAVLPFAAVMRLLRLRTGEVASPSPSTYPSDEAATAVARAIGRAGRRLPVSTRCLPRAVAAALMLRRRGLAAEVHFGVAKRDGAVAAHAWTNCGAVAVTGGQESTGYSPIAVFRA